jgi:argininosuccinate lyase
LIGQLVAKAMKRGIPLAKMTVEEFQAAHPSLDHRVYDVLGAHQAVEAFTSHGSTNPTQVAHQLSAWRKRLEAKGI